ncbi:MAG: hypothetical protein M3N59_02980 [bacterium]|nr:hypothetical protein [bacterium]
MCVIAATAAHELNEGERHELTAQTTVSDYILAGARIDDVEVRGRHCPDPEERCYYKLALSEGASPLLRSVWETEACSIIGFEVQMMSLRLKRSNILGPEKMPRCSIDGKFAYIASSHLPDSRLPGFPPQDILRVDRLPPPPPEYGAPPCC